MYGADLRVPTDGTRMPWYERLGFRLPPMYPVDPAVAAAEHLDEPAPAAPSGALGIEPSPPRPSSIDGRRPRSNLNMRIDLGPAPHKRPARRGLSRGRSFTVRGLEESEELMAESASSTYGSDDDAGVSEHSVCVVPASDLPPLSIVETGILAMQFAIVWFAANWSFVAALGYTSVASGTTLGASSGFFTLLLGSMVGTDTFAPGKVVSVVLSFLGVALVTWSDHGTSSVSAGDASNPLLGDMLAILSALCYAVYVTLLKVRIGSEDRISMPLFFGFVGLFNLVAFWPVGLMLDWLGIEPLALPSDANIDFAYLLAMLKSSPLFTTIGLSLTIPMAALGGMANDPSSLHLQNVVGGLLVLLSFAAIAWEENASA
ncbi:hypothetical protein CBS14141_000335 [Malassezia furfur]|nr:hypothetical protein CBS14141_000335 [Malassezia furfur]